MTTKLPTVEVVQEETLLETSKATAPHCGIIMPLSDTDGYPSGHWKQVQRLIIRAAEKAKFTASMVSENAAEDMIQASIVRNVYQNDVVVCDVSGMNPNVMLELGLRMATLLPLVLVFDGEKDYPFDIRNILHARYPKGLNIFEMENFVSELADKIRKVHEAQQKKEYTPFLSHFKEVKIEPAQLNSTSQSISEALQTVVDEMSSIKSQLKSMNGRQGGSAKITAEIENIVYNSDTLTETERSYIQWALRRANTSSLSSLEAKEEVLFRIAKDTLETLYNSSPEHLKDQRLGIILPYIERLIARKHRSGPGMATDMI